MNEARHVLTILAVEEIDAATHFYREAFGWTERIRTPTYTEFLLPGDMRLGLYERHGFGRNIGEVPAQVERGKVAPTELYLHVADLELAITRLTEAGGRLLSARAERPWGDEAAYFADPDGNVVVVARLLTTAGWADR